VKPDNLPVPGRAGQAATAATGSAPRHIRCTQPGPRAPEIMRALVRIIRDTEDWPEPIWEPLLDAVAALSAARRRVN